MATGLCRVTFPSSPAPSHVGTTPSILTPTELPWGADIEHQKPRGFSQGCVMAHSSIQVTPHPPISHQRMPYPFTVDCNLCKWVFAARDTQPKSGGAESG